MQIFESKNKPIVDKNGDIHYRYPGATKKIQKQDLQEILKEQMGKDTMLMLSKHIEQILKNGIENTIILNKTEITKDENGKYFIDESLLPKIAFIKEGEFVETNGAPAFVLKGEVKAYNALVKEKKVQGIDDNDVFQCFFQNRNLTQDESKAYLKYIATASPNWMPMRFFAQKAGINKAKTIEYFNTLIDGSTKRGTIEAKIKILNENQPMMEKSVKWNAKF